MSDDLFSHLYRNLARMEKAATDVRGTLLAGTDPTGIGGVTSGHSAKRALELLVAEGFPIERALEIATLNGARYLGKDSEVGSLEVGKRADIVIVSTDLSVDATSLHDVVLVFKDRVGYDRKTIFASMPGNCGSTLTIQSMSGKVG